jgi:hypothetical protein
MSWVPFPVVHVPVDDEDALPECRARRGGNGHVVDEAEPHGPVARGVMARRADRDEGKPLAPLLERLQGGQARPRGAASRSPRVRHCIGVGVNVAATLRAERRLAGEIRRVVHTRQLLHGCLAEVRRHDLLLGPERARRP